MTTIAVSGVPTKMTLRLFIKKLSWIVKGNFLALGFEQKRKKEKICYIQLSPKLNVHGVIQKINKTPFGQFTLKAYIPNNIPSFPGKNKTLPDRLRKHMKIPLEMDPETCFESVHTSIIREMEHKYTGLHELSAKTNHKLMENICITVRDRLRVVAHNTSILDNPFKFSLAYRKAHPHFGDFQFILSTLHMIEDAEGDPRSQIVEKELILDEEKTLNDMPYNKILDACNKYSDRIIKKVTEHVKNLKTELSANPTEEERARVAVRTQLQKLAPYLSLLVKEVIGRYFQPVKGPNLYKIRIYGEPYLPTREQLEPVTRRLGLRRPRRCDRTFNLVCARVPPALLRRALAADGIAVGSNKLVIRLADRNNYVMPDSLKSKITLKPSPNEQVSGEKDWEQW